MVFYIHQNYYAPNPILIKEGIAKAGDVQCNQFETNTPFSYKLARQTKPEMQPGACWSGTKVASGPGVKALYSQVYSIWNPTGASIVVKSV